jgi:hypothetical protein
MQSILFHAIPPTGRVRDWRHFRQEAEVAVMRAKNVDSLSENVWLIDMPERQMYVADLEKAARKYIIFYKTLEVAHEGPWLLSQLGD